MMVVAVIGAGTMGHGIAQIAAMAGYQTILTDADADLVRQLERRLGRLLDGISVATTATVLGEADEGVQVEVAGSGTSV